MTIKCSTSPTTFSLNSRGTNFAGKILLSDFNLSLGIGSQSSELQLSFLNQWCKGTGGSTVPRVGTPVQFQCNNLTFGGIVNTASISEQSGGFFINISVKDPKETLDNVTIIVKDYYCNISTTCGQEAPNLINAARIMEVGAAICPPGLDFQNWPRTGFCGTFGSSAPLLLTPNSGVSTVKVLMAISGQPIYTTSGERLNLNVGALIATLNARAPYSKIEQTSISLLQLITEAANDCGCDFFVELFGMTTVNINLIDRTIPASNGIISGIIAQAKNSGKLVSSEFGQSEIYATSNRVVIGDKIKYLAECPGYGNAHMMLGYDLNGYPVRVNQPNFSATIDTRGLRLLGFPYDTFTITEEEILCSASQQMWIIYGHINPRSLSGTLLSLLGLGENQGNVRDLLNSLGILFRAGNGIMPNNNQKTIQEAMTTIFKSSSQLAKQENLLLYSQAWQWFNEFIQTYYGRQWLIPMNSQICVYPAAFPRLKPGESYEYLSDMPVDSGYPSPSQLNNIRGLVPGVDTALFETSDGNLTGFFEIPSNLTRIRRINGRDVVFQITSEGLSASSYVVKNNKVYLAAKYGGELHLRQNKYDVLMTIDTMIPMVPAANNKALLNQGLRAFLALFGKGLYDIIKNRTKGAFDVSTLNTFALRPAAGGPDYIVVPMQSNLYVYGPWCGGSGSAGAIGSTEVEVKSDINPWGCGGYGPMITVGQSFANRGLRTSNVDEAGSFTLAEGPSYNINYFTQNRLLVDSVSVNYNSGGITTKYSFKTFASKFGDYGQDLADIVKQSVSMRNETLAEIRNQRKKIIESINTIRNAFTKMYTDNLFGLDIPVERRSSPGFLLIGGYHNTDIPNQDSAGGTNPFQIPVQNELSCSELCAWQAKSRPPQPEGGYSIKRSYEVGLNPKYEIEDSVKGPAFVNLGIMSLDGLLSPVSLQGRNNGISRMCQSWNTNAHMNSATAGVAHKTRLSMPPINNNDPQPINQKYLNPIVSLAILNSWDGRGTSREGFNIQYVGYGTDVSDMEDRALRKTQTDFSFYSLRGPLVLQAWGYDTEGKPIPNIIDSPHQTELGIFKNAGTKDKFMNNWLDNPASWPVGPIDLRFDRDRGVWVCPPGDRIVVAQLKEDLSAYGSATAVLINPASGGRSFYESYSIYGPNGEDYSTDITNTYITVYDFLGRNLCSATRVYAAYNDGKYIVLESSFVNDETCECVCATPETSPTTETTTETPTCDNICGLLDCLKEINGGSIGNGVLGIYNKCLTIYPVTDCYPPETPTPTPE